MGHPKSDYDISLELKKLIKLNQTSPSKPETNTNRVCGCGRKIKDSDIFFMRFESGENPELYCEFCVNITM